jgi:hypothetical protein
MNVNIWTYARQLIFKKPALGFNKNSSRTGDGSPRGKEKGRFISGKHPFHEFCLACFDSELLHSVEGSKTYIVNTQQEAQLSTARDKQVGRKAKYWLSKEDFTNNYWSIRSHQLSSVAP